MAYLRAFPFRYSRKAALMSAGVVALAAAGAIGELSTAGATAVNEATASKQNAQPAPSFAPLIARVKPAVVSVKVKLVELIVQPPLGSFVGQLRQLAARNPTVPQAVWR